MLHSTKGGLPMPRGKAKQDIDMLTHALLGYEHKKSEIDQKIREIRSLIGGSKSAPSTSGHHDSAAPAEKAATGRKRVLSPEARKRIAAAQKKRWAEHRKNTAQAE
jgi:hypothetical protein